MNEAEKFLRNKSISFYAENLTYHRGLVVRFEDVIEVMEEYCQSKVNDVVLDACYSFVSYLKFKEY